MSANLITQPRRLIVCDDDADFAREVWSLATAEGMEARIANSASEFLSTVGAYAPDVIVMDLRLPGTDGVALARQVARCSSAPRLIFTSAMGAPALRAARSIAEATGYGEVFDLEKPIDPSRLLALLARPRASDASPLAGDVAPALAAGAFELHYQPILNLSTGAIDGAEGLVRWRHPNEGLLSPARFLKLVAQSGRMHGLTMAVVEDGLARLASWRRSGFDITLSVNVPVTSVMHPDFGDWLFARLARAGIPPSSLVLEITESEARADLTAITDVLLKLRIAGIGIALDDFGTGFASLQDLWQMPLTHVKIDRFFLRNCRNDSRGRGFFGSIIALCRSLDLSVCGEGIESAEELGFLRDLGCDRAQGYIVSRPMPPLAFAAFLQAPREMSSVGDVTARRLPS